MNDEGVPKNLTYLFVNKVERISPSKTTEIFINETTSNEARGSNFSFATPKYIQKYRNGKKIDFLAYGFSALETEHIKHYIENEPSLKVFRTHSIDKTQTSFEDSPHDIFDSQNNKVLGGSFYFKYNDEKIAVAHHDLVTPAYLIEFREEKEVAKIEKKMLYKYMNVQKLDDESKDFNGKLKCQFKTFTYQSIFPKTNNYSSKEFYA